MTEPQTSTSKHLIVPSLRLSAVEVGALLVLTDRVDDLPPVFAVFIVIAVYLSFQILVGRQTAVHLLVFGGLIVRTEIGVSVVVVDRCTIAEQKAVVESIRRDMVGLSPVGVGRLDLDIVHVLAAVRAGKRITAISVLCAPPVRVVAMTSIRQLAHPFVAGTMPHRADSIVGDELALGEAGKVHATHPIANRWTQLMWENIAIFILEFR